MPFLLVLLLALPGVALAHGGGLDARGGHTSSRTGDYHCHREPCRSEHRDQEAALEEAKAAGRGHSSLYDRDAWPHWADDNGDCRDTRAEVLIRASQVPVTFNDTDRCVVATGLWIDPYTGELFQDASDMDIDHVVPLHHAHGHGADRWTRDRRADFANDPENLLPVSASANRSKGAEGPDDWVPENRAFWCEYGKRWAAVKAEYGLQVTPPEEKAVKRLKQACPASVAERRGER